MNKIYRLVWNKSLSLWTVVSENARGVTKKRNVVANTSVITAASSSTENYKQSQLKPSLMALTISSIFLSSGAFAATNTGGGTVSNNGNNSLAMSPTAQQCGNDGQATVNGSNGMAIGCGTSVGALTGTNQQLNNRRGAGVNNYPTGEASIGPSATAIGKNNKVSNPGGATLVGTSNISDGTANFHNVGVGQGNRLGGAGYNTALGIGNDANGGNSNVAIGVDNRARSNTAIAIGRQTYVDANYGIGLGSTATVAEGATGGIAMGQSATTKGTRGIAIGSSTNGTNVYDAATAPNADGTDSVAVGTGAKAAGNQTTAVGRQAKAGGDNSSAYGNEADAQGASAVAVGDKSQSKAARSVALGANAIATNADDVALGAGSETSTATGTGYLTGTAAPASVVSVGKAGAERRIQHVSDGAADTDAVNVRQLKTVKDVVDAQGETTAGGLGGGSTYDPTTGTVSNPTYNINGNEVNNVGDALTELDKGWTLQSNGADAGAVKAGDTVDIGTADGEENLQVAKEGNDIKYSLNRDLKVDSVTAGDTVINNDGLTIANGPSITKSGIDAAGNPISNVGPGVAGTDAVNKDQLDQSNQELTDKGFGLTAQDGTTVQKKLGEAVDVVGADENITTKVQDGKVAIELAKDLNVNSVTAGDTVINNDGLTIANGPSVTKSGIDAAGNKISNVAAGTDDTDAVNKSQLDEAMANAGGSWTLQSNGANAGDVNKGDVVDIGTADGEENLQVTKEGNDIKYSLNRDLKVDSVTAGDTVINNDGLSIANGPSVTKDGIDAAGNTISNVGPGVAGTDAVNKDQLDKAGQDLTDKGFGLTAQDGSTVQKKLGEAVDVVGADENITTKVQDGKVAIELAKDLNVNSVTAGDSVLNTDGLTIANGPSVTKSGIDAAGNKITNVADGDVNPDSKDAINGSQLANNAQSVSDALGGGSTVNPDGTMTAPNYNINGTDVNNVGDAITALDKGWTLQSNGTDAGAVKAGDTVDIGTADGEENLQVTKEGNDIKYSLNRDLKVDSVTAGDTVINNDGLSIVNGPSITKSGIDAAGNTISNVGPGVAGTDAVNKDQLDSAAAAAKTTVTEGDNIVVTESKNADGSSNYEVATAKDLVVDSVTAGDTVLNNDGLSITDGPSVTKSGIDAAGNKITNVTDGDVNPDSKDAINGSQLAKNAQSVSDALGGGSTVNPDGTVTAPNYNINGTDVSNVGDALTELDKGWTLQSNGADAGAVKAGDTVDIGTADGEENLQVAKEGNDIKYSLNRDLKVDSVTAGDTVINNDGLTIANGPSITKSGIDAAGNTISNVGPGVAGTDAVNKDQLDKAGQDLTDKGFGLTAQDGTTVQKKLGEAVDVVGADENITTKVQDGKVAIELAKDLNVNSVTAGDSVLNTDGLTIANGPSVTKSGIDAGNQKITNVADGEVAAGSKDAVNGGQLNDSVGSTGDILGGGVTNEGGKLNGPFTVNDQGYDTVADAIKGESAKAKTEVEAGKNVTVESRTGADGQTIYQVATADDVEFNSVKVGDVTVDGATGKITGVTDGDINPDSKDAINGSQLAKNAQSVSDALGGGSTVNPDGTVTAPNYTVNGNDMNNVGDAITELDKGWTLQSNGENAAAVKAGDTVDIGTADGEENLQVAKEGNDIKYSLNRDLKVDSVTAGDTVINNDGLTIVDGPSVTKDGINAGNKKITGVAPGTVSPDSTDAINGSQLHAQGEGVKDIIGGDTAYDPNTGKYTNPDIGGTGKDNINDAIGSLGQAAREAKTTVSDGDNIVVTESKNADGSTNYEVATAKDVTFDSVKVGDVMVDGATGKITGVTDGDINPDSKDAINGSQLAKNAQSVSDALGGGSTVNPDGTVTAPNYTVNGADVNNVGDAITALDKGWTLQSNGENAAAVKAGDTVDIGTADGEENLQVAKEGNDIKYSLNRDLKVDSVTAGDTVINNDGLTIVDGPSVTKDGINAGNKKITGVAPGTVSPDSTDAINGSQLHAQGEGVKDIIGGDTAYDPNTGKYTNPDIGGTGKDNINDAIGSLGQAAREAKTTVSEGDNIVVTESKNADGSTNYEVATAKDVTFDSVKVGDVTVDGATGKITGVTDGDINPDSKDAINGSQLAKNAQSVSDALGGGSTVNPDGTVSAPNYTVNGNDMNNVGDAITELDKGWTLQSNGANAGAVKAGDTVDIGTADGEENLQVAKEGNDIKYSLNRDLKVDSVTAGNTRLDNSGVEVKDAVGSSTTMVAGGTIVKDAQGNSTATTAAGTTIKDAQGNGTLLNGTGLAFTDASGAPVGPSVSRTGIDAGGQKITNVADGEVAAGSKDAVNGGQLNDSVGSTGDILGGGVTNEGGKLNGPFTVNDQGYDTVADAIKGESAKAKTEVEAGKNVTVESETGADGQTIYTVATADEVDFNKVTVGDVTIDGATGKISGVAPGTVSADSTEAINGSQLHAQGEGVKDIIGGDTVYDPNTGKYTNPSIGGTGKDNINDAIGAVGDAATKAKSTVTEGDNIVVTESKNDDGSTNYEVATAKDVTFDSVKVGDVTVDGATGKITGVTDGDINPDSKDAINGSQLAKNAQSVSDALGGGSTVNPDGTVSKPNYTVNGDSLNNVGDAITALDKGWTLQSNGENAGAVKAGDTVDIGTADGEENLQVAKEGNDIKYSLNRDLKVDSVTAGDTILNTDGLTITNGPSVTKDGINAGNKKITGVAPGTVSPDSQEAINGSQLNAQGEGVKNIIGGNTVYDPNTGKYTNPSIGGTGKDNINDAIGAVGDAAKAAKTTVKQGENIVVTETKNADGSTNYDVATAKDVKFDSVTATDEEGNETVLTATGTQVKDGEGNEAEYGAKGIQLKDSEGKGTLLNQEGLSFVDGTGANIGPSITAGGINAGNTVIGGVAAGRVAADSQEAINGSQLHAQGEGVKNIIGGNTVYDPNTGKYTNPDIGGTGKDNINDAIGAVGDAATKAKSTVSEGKNIAVKESKNKDGSTNYEVSTTPDLEVDSVTAGGIKVDGNGLTIEGGPSVTKDGIDAGDKKVTGVADGEVAKDSKDAINGGQLKGVSDSVAGAIGGKTTVNPDGTIKTEDIGGTGENNINDAIGAVGKAAQAAKTTVSNKDKNITVNETTRTDGSKDYEVGLAKDISVDSVTAKDVNANQVNVKGDKGTTNITGGGISITGPKGEAGPSMTTDGINAGGKKVTGVADGTIAKGSQDGINGGQLHQSYQDVGSALGGGAGYDPEKGWKGPTYNVAGGTHNNVGDALGALNQADQALDNRITNLGDQMQQAFYDTNRRIDDVEKKANAGVAAAIALEAAPFVAGKYTYAVGAAYHGGENAFGATLRKTADNGRWSLTGGVAAASQGDPSFRLGLSGVID
ncbi:ESPR-type extended signal peptide-containing protein [Acinetobacter sp. ANC 3882]|uniref:ESPR-type extended signal peptide-containing protein n=1 Tax=Acinetobacter sp. ANC 3882 TaxID=2923423 RepID=UPI001F4B0D83|nr:ESPR-type extended signal peptide-containing protein [Acinetobacter sp. ANC 3882]MCH7316217.1 hypothetical protein [Acinetobacter sp. ANC 3882]